MPDLLLLDRIMGVSPTERILYQNTFVEQILNAPASRVLGTFHHLSPFGGSKVDKEIIEQVIHHLSLSLIEGVTACCCLKAAYIRMDDSSSSVASKAFCKQDKDQLIQAVISNFPF